MHKPQLQSEFLDLVESLLEEQLKEVIAVFQNLPQEVLLLPGLNNGWSIAECFAHLNSYADFYIPRLTKAIDTARPADDGSVFRHSLLGRYFIKSMNPDGSMKKFKAMKKHLPGEVADPHAVISSFIGHLERLLVLCRSAKGKVLKRNAVTTSIAAMFRMNIGDTMIFLITHNRRHLNQAMRLLAR